MVLATFVGPCPVGMEACHNNGDPSDNRLSNLRWDTNAGNKADMVRHGTAPLGERNPLAALTDAEVRGMRQLMASGATQEAIAEAYGVSGTTVTRIKRSHGWGKVSADGPADVRPVRTMHGNQKVTPEMVAEIRRLRAEGLSYPAIGRAVGVDQTTAHRVICRAANYAKMT
jgi:DNA invertase Pin-like site-specific DNA recombinase